MDHERRYGAPGERLRSDSRVALLEVPRVRDLSLEGLVGGTGLRVLDVGTGTGIFAEAFVERGLMVTGLDPNPHLLEEARRLVPGAAFVSGTAEDLRFPDRSYDVVFLAHVLHETDDPQRALSEARRVARQRVVALEWPYVDEDKGPPLAHRLPPSDIESFSARAGFLRVERVDLAHMQLYRLAP